MGGWWLGKLLLNLIRWTYLNNIQLVNKSKILSQNKYTQLLTILIGNFILVPFLQGNIGELLSSAIFLYAIIIIVKTFSLKTRFIQVFSGIACLAFLLEILGRWGLYETWTVFFWLLIQAIYIIYLAVAAYLILQDIFLSERVTKDTIRGSICVYFLIGFIWSLLYGITASLDSSNFSQPIVAEGSFNKAIYFSFTTLTTLGYGDIIPVSPLAKMLTNLEAIIGQMYPAILIATLVGMYTSQRTK